MPGHSEAVVLRGVVVGAVGVMLGGRGRGRGARDRGCRGARGPWLLQWCSGAVLGAVVLGAVIVGAVGVMIGGVVGAAVLGAAVVGALGGRGARGTVARAAVPDGMVGLPLLAAGSVLLGSAEASLSLLQRPLWACVTCRCRPEAAAARPWGRGVPVDTRPGAMPARFGDRGDCDGAAAGAAPARSDRGLLGPPAVAGWLSPGL